MSPARERRGRRWGEERAANRGRCEAQETDLLILSDGTVLAHNLTPGMADVLQQINPRDESMGRRAGAARKRVAKVGAERAGGGSGS